MAKKIKSVRIVMVKNRIITREDLFRRKETFHRNQAKMPFEEKIAALVQLQKISSSIRPAENKIVWKI